MDRLRFEPAADDVTMLYRRLMGNLPIPGDHVADAATWETIAAALDRALALAAVGGCAPATLEAMDVALVRVVRAAVDGQRAAFDAGMRVGAALGTLQPPSRN